MRSMLTFLLLSLLAIDGQNIFRCDFDFGQSCLTGLPSASFLLLNSSSDRPRRPASDITAIETSNDAGECLFPFPFNSFDMYFCLKTDSSLPATCPMATDSTRMINCSEGEYGVHSFQQGEMGSRTYPLDFRRSLSTGKHCLSFFSYFSDINSNATIDVLLEENPSAESRRIARAFPMALNRWHEIRADFSLSIDNPAIYFKFERSSSASSLPFDIAIDQIVIIDLECEPLPTTTTSTSTSMSTTGGSLSSSPGTTATTTMTTTTTTTMAMTTTITAGSSSSSSHLTVLLLISWIIFPLLRN